MEKYFYLTVTPESLIASHLKPEDFGNYLAVGTKKRVRGQVIFFEIDPDRIKLPVEYINKRLVPYEDGEPKRSVFLSIYRVLENTPLDALKNLYLVTYDGKVLSINSKVYEKGLKDEVYLYQQFIPTTTRVASKLFPHEFTDFLTDTSKPVFAPKIFFCDMKLGQLATDPYAPLHDLPYRNPDHLRDCLIKLNSSKERLTKTVLRYFNSDLQYRVVNNGFYVGEKDKILFYPMPPVSDLEDKYYSWWRSALTQHL